MCLCLQVCKELIQATAIGIGKLKDFTLGEFIYPGGFKSEVQRLLMN